MDFNKLKLHLNQRVPAADIVARMDISNLCYQQDQLVTFLRSGIMDLNPHYVQLFLKAIIPELEKSEDGVHDEIYEIFCSPDIMSAKELAPTATDKVSYFIGGFSSTNPNNRSFVTIREKPRLISGSNTTGLRTWEAALFLSNYLNDGNVDLGGTSICELGAGTGLVAAALAKNYHYLHAPIKEIIATDGAASLLDVLAETVRENLKEDLKEDIKTVDDKAHVSTNLSNTDGTSQNTDSTSPNTDGISQNTDNAPQSHISTTSPTSSLTSTSHPISSSDHLPNSSPDHLLGPSLKFHQLLWGTTNSSSEDYAMDPPTADYVVAADVTYDSRVVGLLAATIEDFFAAGTRAAYIAATIRNEDTILAWEAELDSRFTWSVVARCADPPKLDGYCWFRSGTPEIRIYEIRKR